MKKYLLVLLFLTSELQAQSLCQRIQDGMVPYLEAPESRINFKNHGGLMDGGVCWWHSRLQRSSAFLIDFKPELERPTVKQVEGILNDLKSMNKVVIIPGFHDFNSFSQSFEKEIQQLLVAWQIEDGFLNLQWIRGISGNYKLGSVEMAAHMETLFDQFNQSFQPIWVMAQIKGLVSHAYLVLDIIPQAKGYDLKVIDSNSPLETRLLRYTHGQTFIMGPKEKYSFVPYLGFQKDSKKIKSSVNRYCGNILTIDKEMPSSAIEVDY